MEQLFDKLKNSGVDVDTTLRRFMGHKEIYLKFLRRFPEETAYAELKTVVESGNYTELHGAAHKMKGLTLNLGMNVLGELSAQIMKNGDEGSYDEIPELMQRLTKNYNDIITAIGTM